MSDQQRISSPYVALMVSIGAAIISIILVMAAAVEVNTSAPVGPNWLRPSSFLVLGVLGACSAASFAAIWWSMVLIRQRKVEDLDPSALVFSSRMTEDLKKITSDVKLRLVKGRITSGFTVAANGQGIAVWSGPIRSPHPVIEIPWKEVSSISPGIVRDLTRNNFGVLVSFRGDEMSDIITLPFAAIGSGPAHMLQLSEQRTAALAHSLELRFLQSQQTKNEPSDHE